MSKNQEAMWANPKIAEIYKAAETITGPFARRLIRQAGLHQVDKKSLVVLDNACGTGIVSSQLYETLDKSAKGELQLTCGDISEGMIKYVQQKIEDGGWKGAKAQIVDAQKTGLPSERFTHVITNFAIMLLPEPKAVLNECFRILQPGGIIAFTTWNELGWITDVRAALANLPGPPPFPDTTEAFLSVLSNGAWHHADYVEQQLAAQGFVDVKVEVAPDSPAMAYSEQFTNTFIPMIEMIASKFWSEEERKRCTDLVKPTLLKYMTEKYGEANPIEMDWVAILATARKPSE